MSVDYDNEKKTVESLILTFKNSVRIRDLQRSYEESFGKKIPYLELGFSSLESFILSMQDSVIARYGYDGSLLLTAKPGNDSSRSIRKLIENQNTSRKKQPRHTNTYSSYRPLSYRHNGYSNYWSNKTSGKCIPFQAQQRIKALLNAHPNGLTAKNLQFYYCKEYPYHKGDLDYQSLGHYTFEDLLATCDHDVLSRRGSSWNTMYYPIFPVYPKNQYNKSVSPNPKGHERHSAQSAVVQQSSSSSPVEQKSYSPSPVDQEQSTRVQQSLSPSPVGHEQSVVGQKSFFPSPVDQEQSTIVQQSLSSTSAGHEQSEVKSKVDEEAKENIDELRVQDDEIYLTFELEYFREIITIPIEMGEVYSPDNFYILIKERSYSEELDHLTSKMENFYRKDKNLDVWKINQMVVMYEQPVVVIHQEDKSLYRGVVTGFKGMYMVEVFLVDFGTICTVAKENLLYLHKMFFDFPAQAINAKLYNIHMKSSSESENQRASEKILDLVNDKGSLQAYIHFVDVENYSLSLEIVEKDGGSYSINDTLVREGYCIYNHAPHEVNDKSKQYVPSTYIDMKEDGCVPSPNLQNQNGNLLDDIDEKVCQTNKDIKMSPVLEDNVTNKDRISPVNGSSDKVSPISSLSRNENVASINDDERRFDSFEGACDGNDLTCEANLTISSSESCLETMNIQKFSDDKIVDAVKSLRIANRCIRLERKKVLERLPINSSLKETFVRLSTVKANIVALEAELVGIFMLRKGNNN